MLIFLHGLFKDFSRHGTALSAFGTLKMGLFRCFEQKHQYADSQTIMTPYYCIRRKNTAF
ncbi:MAG: hypothetical protein EBT71_00250 [Alphaproteobacteria bacterium]|nr:hypothetical protein [Alphaproteobacteria bacterium]